VSNKFPQGVKPPSDYDKENGKAINGGKNKKTKDQVKACATLVSSRERERGKVQFFGNCQNWHKGQSNTDGLTLITITIKL